MSGPAGIYILREERELLHGAPWLVRLLYEALRWRMDFSRFTVGGRYPEVSWAALAEDLEVWAHPGLINAGKPGKSQLRRAGDWLVRRGLVVMRSNPRQWQLIFFLPVAKRGFFERNKPDKNPTGQPDRGLHRGKPTYPDTYEMAQPDTHLRSVGKHHYDTTGGGDSNYGAAVDNLIVPSSTTPEEKTELLRLLSDSRINGQAQAILDELAGATEKGAIRSKTAYAIGLIKRVNAGTFVLDKGKEIAAKRARSTPERSEGRQAMPEAKPVSSAQGRAYARAALDNLKGGKHGRA